MKLSNEFPPFRADGGRSKEDLIAVLAGWQLDADRIFMFAEDLEKGVLDDACRELFGERDGPKMLDLIGEAHDIGDGGDDDLFQAAILRFLGDE